MLRPPPPGQDEGSGDDPLKEASWLYSYADLVTQLLLFTLLTVTAIGLKNLQGLAPAEDTVAEKMEQTAQLFRTYVETHDLGDMIAVDQSAGQVVVRLKSLLLFGEASASLSHKAKRILDDIVALLQVTPRPIRVEGHTDDRVINTSRFPSNWELSSARAIAVVEYLEARGIEHERLSASGYGEYRPIVPNDTPTTRSLNRRVEIVILGQEG